MSLKFLDLQKILLKLNVEYIGTSTSTYAVYDGKEFAKKLRQKRLWIALDENNELRVSKSLLDCGNTWLDVLAHMKDNQPEAFEELIK